MSKFSQFWQELKRRNVVRVITVYAGAAFVIIELINNISEPLNLPEWTPTFVIVLLAIGFPVVIIFSWIYDVSPEGGMVRTEPAGKSYPDELPSSTNRWKIASYVSFVVICGLIVLNIILRSDRSGADLDFDKSIAVLPFESLSKDEDLQYQADGVMDAILLHLSKIEDLRVMSRTSVEQYRNSDKTIPEICEEMGVAYVLEGSFQKSGNQIRLIVQLIRSGTEGHVWANNYDREWDDIFAVQSEVAQAVAGELRAVIAPEEIDLIEKIPTFSLTAFDYYQKGREEYFDYQIKGDLRALERSEELYHDALANDPAYAEAYVGLADVYWTKNRIETYFSENYMDSVLVLANTALSYDRGLASAYARIGRYYMQSGERDKALGEFSKAIELNPNDWFSYSMLGYIYGDVDKVKSIESLQKAASLNRGPELYNLLTRLGDVYESVGLRKQASQFYAEAFKLSGDSAIYYLSEYLAGTPGYLESLETFRKIYEFDSTNYDALYQIGYYYLSLGLYKESLAYFNSWIEKDETQDIHTIEAGNHRIAYALWQNGYLEKANSYFDQQLEYCYRTIELGRPYARIYLSAYYDLAAVYAFRGETDRALENLRIFNQNTIFSYFMVPLIHDDPLFDSIRDEPEFKQIVRDVEAKYQAEHERVRQWLEEHDML